MNNFHSAKWSFYPIFALPLCLQTELTGACSLDMTLQHHAVWGRGKCPQGLLQTWTKEKAQTKQKYKKQKQKKNMETGNAWEIIHRNAFKEHPYISSYSYADYWASLLLSLIDNGPTCSISVDNLWVFILTIKRPPETNIGWLVQKKTSWDIWGVRCFKCNARVNCWTVE